MNTPRAEIRSLAQLDALIGRYVMGYAPEVYWEDSYTNWRFDNLPEALEAMRDPFFSALVPVQSRPRSSLKEVYEFPAYSTHLATAFTVVEQLGKEAKALMLSHSKQKWMASFEGHSVAAESAPVAICLAALRCKGIEVQFAHDFESDTGPAPFLV